MPIVAISRPSQLAAHRITGSAEKPFTYDFVGWSFQRDSTILAVPITLSVFLRVAVFSGEFHS
jgi:hypothetical protein